MTRPHPNQAEVHQALKLWHAASDNTSPFDACYRFQRARRQAGHTVRQATNELLLDALNVMAADYDAQAAKILRLRFCDELPMHRVANEVNLAESTANRKQQQAMQSLTHILQNLEAEARRAYEVALEQRLDLPPRVHLVGTNDVFEAVLPRLLAPEAPWLVSLEGLGGIGKTALANELVRAAALLSRFETVAWVSARQQEFWPGLGLVPTRRPALDADSLVNTLLGQLTEADRPALSPEAQLALLKQHLKTHPTLVVIDNLETVVDYETLLPTLRKLVNPSRFLLTSRSSLQAFQGIVCFSLQELSRADTLVLLQHEAQTRRLISLENASPAQLESIYTVVGGNPLALKLVAGQMHSLPLSRVLERLRQAEGKKVDELYTFIYWQAWQMLEPTSRQTLLVMPLVQNGTFDQLATVSQLDPAILDQAIGQLTLLSLLEVSGDVEQRRYRIHALTETFLLHEVVKWQA